MIDRQASHADSRHVGVARQFLDQAFRQVGQQDAGRSQRVVAGHSAIGIDCRKTCGYSPPDVLADLGAIVEEVNTDYLHEGALANAIMTQADGAAFHRDRLKEHPDWFGADVRQRLETGAKFTSTEYALARRTQAEVRRRCDNLFEEFDVLILPTTPITAPILEGENAVERARLLTRLTAPFNVTGLPALSIPCGFTSEGLPIGLQIVSRAWNESGVLRIGYSYQEATDWHRMRPSIATAA